VYSSVNPLQAILFILAVIWFLGAAALLSYSIYTYWKLKQRVGTAILLENNIYECDSIDSPCVVGLIKPRIYLPIGLSPQERSYILKHEQTHIKRFDYLVKPLAFLALCIHWFNPLVWLSFLLMGRDMEMSCDEGVLKSFGPDIKKAYSSSLLSFASEMRVFSGSPLTFGEQNAENRIKNVLSYRRLPAWTLAVILLALVLIGVSLLSNPASAEDPAAQPGEQSFSGQELYSMAEAWAEALKTRDGEPRYEMMSENMKEAFIAAQKLRSEPWNFNIGVSSPWVTSYEITVKADSAEILYHMTDSTQQTYDKKEIIYFGEENGKIVVTEADELLSDWERYYYYAPTAAEAMKVYRKALLESDYLTILSLTHSAELEPVGQQIWDTIKISDVRVVGQDVRDYNACYELELTIEDGGNSSFEKGVSPRWLWLVKGDQGWYVEGLMTGGSPDQDWWSSGTPVKTGIEKEDWNTGSFEFDQLLYLSPLSSSTFDYAESQMNGTKFKISDDLFEIDYPNWDDFRIRRPVYAREAMTDDMIRTFENSMKGKVSISEYTRKYRYTIYMNGDHKTNYRLYALDDELWLSSYADNTADKSEIVMNLWKLK
jgi:hypothetical protein